MVLYTCKLPGKTSFEHPCEKLNHGAYVPHGQEHWQHGVQLLHTGGQGWTSATEHTFQIKCHNRSKESLGKRTHSNSDISTKNHQLYFYISMCPLIMNNTQYLLIISTMLFTFIPPLFLKITLETCYYCLHFIEATFHISKPETE